MMMAMGKSIVTHSETGSKDKRFESCLMCSSCSAQGLDSLGMLKHPKKKKGPSGRRIPRLPGAGLMSPQLWAHFVLTRVLKIPSEQVGKLLGRMEGSHPGEWFIICFSCSKLVRRLFELYQKVGVLQGEIRGLQKRARKDILKSWNPVVEEEEEEGHLGLLRRRNNMLTARQHIWDLVSRGNKRAEGNADGVEEDEIATKLGSSEGNDDDDTSPQGNPTFARENEEDGSYCFGRSESYHQMDLELEVNDGWTNKEESKRKRSGRPPNVKQDELHPNNHDDDGTRCPRRKRNHHQVEVEVKSDARRRKGSQEEAVEGAEEFEITESDQEDEPDEMEDGNDPQFGPEFEEDNNHHDDFSEAEADSSEPPDCVAKKVVKIKQKSRMGRPPKRKQLQVTADDSLIEEFGVNKRIKIVRKSERNKTTNTDDSSSLSKFSGPGDECKICGEWYRLEYMESHLQFHSDFKHTTCQVCNYPAITPKILQGHMSRMHDDDGQWKNFWWECDKCEFITAIPTRKRTHERQHKYEDSLVKLEDGIHYSCELCGRIYPNYDTASTHREAEHASKFQLPDKDFYLRSKRRPRKGALQSILKDGDESEQNSKADTPAGEGDGSNNNNAGDDNCEDNVGGFPGPGSKCQICENSGFAEWFGIDDMEGHIQLHEKYKEFTCDICHYPFKSQRIMESHKRLWHKGGFSVYYYKCFKCEFVTRIYHRRDVHVKRHKIEDNLSSDGTLWRCRLCQDTFNSRSEARIHLQGNKHGAELGLREFKCSHCEKLFPTGTGMRNHIQVHHTPNRRRLVCDICGGSFLTNHSLKKHTKSFHSDGGNGKGKGGKRGEGGESVLCDICGKTFAFRRGMLEHRRSQHFRDPNQEKSSQKGRKCSHCDFFGPNKKAISKHLKSEHADLYTEQCDVCDAKLFNLTELLKHKRRVHNS